MEPTIGEIREWLGWLIGYFKTLSIIPERKDKYERDMEYAIAIRSRLSAPPVSVTMDICEAFAEHVMQYGLDAKYLAEFLRKIGVNVVEKKEG